MVYSRFMKALAVLVNEPSNTVLSEAVQDFVAAKSLSASPHTIADYSVTLGRFLRYFDPRGTMNDITTKELREFLSTIPGSKKNVLNAYIAISSLWTWAIKEGYCREHLPRRIEAPKPQQTVIRPFSRNEVGAMLSHGGRMEKRNRALITFLLDTGVRASELCGIQIRDIHENYVRILGKGSKEREVPVSDRTFRFILEYLTERNFCGLDSDYLFATEDGRPYNRHALLKLIKRIGKRAGVENCHPHRFRHTFAVNFLVNGGDPFTLQRILGHSTMQMVNRYISLAREDLARVHQKASPVRNWGLEP